MEIAFGRYCVELVGSDSLTKFLQSSWKNYIVKEVQRIPDFRMFIERIPSFDDTVLKEGWNTADFQGDTIQVYSTGNKAVFAVQYRPEQTEATVFVNEESRSVRLGIQFGTLLLMHYECIGLHGVTLICGQEIIVLSAPSGTGKTTLGKLLEQYCDAVVINGDFALLHPTEEGVIFEPTPFCGTSGRSLKFCSRINRIVFLSQAKENTWHELSGREAVCNVLNNAFVPTWDSGIQQTVQENIMKCLSAIKVNAYAFAPTQEAAETFFRELKM